MLEAGRFIRGRGIFVRALCHERVGAGVLASDGRAGGIVQRLGGARGRACRDLAEEQGDQDGQDEPDDSEQDGVTTQLGSEEQAGGNAAEETGKAAPGYRLEAIGTLRGVDVLEATHPI